MQPISNLVFLDFIKSYFYCIFVVLHISFLIFIQQLLQLHLVSRHTTLLSEQLKEAVKDMIMLAFCHKVNQLHGDVWILKFLRNIFNVRVVAATTRALLDGLTVYVSNETTLNVMNDKSQCGDSLTDGTGVDVITFDCNGTLVGRYVYITTSTTGQFAICEVMLNVQTGVLVLDYFLLQ